MLPVRAFSRNTKLRVGSLEGSRRTRKDMEEKKETKITKGKTTRKRTNTRQRSEKLKYIVFKGGK